MNSKKKTFKEWFLLLFKKEKKERSSSDGFVTLTIYKELKGKIFIVDQISYKTTPFKIKQL